MTVVSVSFEEPHRTLCVFGRGEEERKEKKNERGREKTKQKNNKRRMEKERKEVAGFHSVVEKM